MANIYLSSTFEDLKEYRAVVYQALRQMRHDANRMEDYTADDHRPLDKCLADVAASDVYVGIFAWRYGYIPQQDNLGQKSITELEYSKAGEVSKPRLIFLLDESVPWPRLLMDEVTGAGERGARIRQFRESLGQAHVRAVFKTPADLATNVTTAISNLQQERMSADIERQRQKLAEESERRSLRTGLRVVGQHVLDVGAHFKGRINEQRELGRLLADKSTRVVSVIGRPGIGKTALASKVLGDLENNHWPHTDNRIPVDGIVYLSTRTQGLNLEKLFLDCAALLGGEKEAALTRAWANTNLRTGEKIERLLEALDEGLYVILLDHVEDLLDTNGRIADTDLHNFVERSLAAPHGARVLVTSRTPLAFESGLLRFDQRVPLTAGLSIADGVTFLREMDPGGICGLRDLPAEELARAVERLHGIPRALEVLAGIAKAEPLCSLGEILESLHEKDAADGLIKEGYRRLDKHERLVMEALAVLSRPVPKVAVEFMVAPSAPGLAVDAVLRRLIELLMVDADRVTKTVKLNPIDQDYAYQQLPKDGEYSRRALERRAADFYAQLRVPREKWRRIVDVEPYLLEFEHRVRAEDFDAAAEVLSQIDVQFVLWRGYARRLQSMHLALEGKIKDPRHKMLHAYGLGQARVFLGPLEDAIEYLRAAQVAAREIGDRQMECRATGAIGEVCRRLGRLDEAITCLEQAVRMPVANKQDTLLLLLSLAYSYKRRFQDALECGQRLMDTALSQQDQALEAQAHDALSLACLGLGKFDDALAHANQATDIYHERDDRDPLGYVLNVQGMAHLGEGRIKEAIDFFEQGRIRGHDDDNPRIEGFCLFNLARASLMQNDSSKALDLASQAGDIFTRIGAAEAPAAVALAEAIHAAKVGNRTAQIKALLACARCSSATADLHNPNDLLAEAEALARAEGLADLAAETHRARSEVEGQIR